MERVYVVTRTEITEMIAEGVKLALGSFAIPKIDTHAKPALTRVELADYLNISLSKLDQMTKSGELKSFKLGGRQVRYKLADIESYLQKKG